MRDKCVLPATSIVVSFWFQAYAMEAVSMFMLLILVRHLECSSSPVVAAME